MMTYHPITAQQACAFIRANISNPRIPAGHKWFYVCDLQRFPLGRNMYLIATASGLAGVMAVDMREVAA